MRVIALALCAITLAVGQTRAAEAPGARVDPELLSAAREIHEQLESSGLLLGDARLDSYLQSIADRLFAAGERNGLPAPTVRVVKGALPNAFALPDGRVYVTTELLVRLRSEAQLATVLAHELVHYTHQHAQRQLKTEGRRSTASTLFTLLLAGLAGSATGSEGIGRSVAFVGEQSRRTWMLASMSGYSRDLEREADLEGFSVLKSAGFDTRDAPAAFDVLDDVAETDPGLNPKFASHPLLAERRASYESLVAATAITADVVHAPSSQTSVAWAERIGDLPKRQLHVKLAQRDFASGVKLAERVASTWPGDGEVHYLKGEMLRLSRQPDGQTIEAYARAVSLDGAPPDAWRQLGYLYRRVGRELEAADAFAKYLALVPSAVEAPLLRGFIERTRVTATPKGAIK